MKKTTRKPVSVVKAHFADLCNRIAALLDEPTAIHIYRGSLEPPLPSWKLTEAALMQLVKEGRARKVGRYYGKPIGTWKDECAEPVPCYCECEASPEPHPHKHETCPQKPVKARRARKGDTFWLEGWTGEQWQVLRELHPAGVSERERDTDAARQGMGAINNKGPLRVRVERVLWQEKAR